MGEEQAIRIAVIGDVHLCWDERDVAFFDRSDYDLVLFVGDLAGYRYAGAKRVARSIGALRKPAVVMPGNHDGVTLPQLVAEVTDAPRGLRDVLGRGMGPRVDAIDQALGEIPLAGYSLHRFEIRGERLAIVGARPHSMGGPSLGFPCFMRERHGVASIEESADRIAALFESAEDDRIVVLAHSGPSGLGSRRSDIWGCDFRKAEGDWGDRDLEIALSRARDMGARVVAVVAGHMHHRLKGGGLRRLRHRAGGVLHANAARVPRRRSLGNGDEGHHLRVVVEGEVARAEDVWTPLGASARREAR